jgi:hypothetical protein
MGLLDQPLTSELIKKKNDKRYSKRGNLLTKRQLKRIEQRAERLLRRELKQQFGRMPKYAEYINSAAWRRRCIKFYETCGRICAACGSAEDLNVHHMAYTHMGHERDEELAVLCAACHAEYHALNENKRQLASVVAL